jgi:sugar phosphate isomerase/epimerase
LDSGFRIGKKEEIMRKLAGAFLLLIFVLSSGYFFEGFEATNGKKDVRRDYQSIRIKEFPVAVQCWTFRKFTFFEALEKTKALDMDFVQAYPGQLLSPDLPGVKFDLNLSKEMIDLVKKKLRESGMGVAAFGVVNFKNDEKSMRQVFDFAKGLGIGTIVTEPDYDDFSLLERMVKEYNINIAIHNHPIPNTYANPETVLERVEGLDSRIGACADTGHWMRSGVNPVEALRLLEGRIIDVHLKDLDAFGEREAQDVPFGQGMANVHDILAELTLQNFGGFLTVEHENKDEVDHPSPSIRGGLDYIQSITYYHDYQEILARSRGRYSKHGWNQYGPGYFSLDEKSGFLEGHGGMGLFWYSKKMFKDFILELDYRCADENTNSGIFLRVPDVPASDDYIYHSFEVQISDSGRGTHQTAAVFDAEAPERDATKEPGGWNHMKITFQGNKI